MPSRFLGRGRAGLARVRTSPIRRTYYRLRRIRVVNDPARYSPLSHTRTKEPTYLFVNRVDKAYRSGSLYELWPDMNALCRRYSLAGDNESWHFIKPRLFTNQNAEDFKFSVNEDVAAIVKIIRVNGLTPLRNQSTIKSVITLCQLRTSQSH